MQNNNVFLLNPDNADILNGVRRAPNAPKKMGARVKLVLIVGGLAYLVMTLVGVVWMVTTLANWAALNAYGVTVEGRLIGQDTRITRTPGSFINPMRYLLYTYTTADGQTLEGRVQVRQQAYQDYVYNAPAQVLYLPDTPGVSRLTGENIYEFEPFPVLAGGANALMVLFIALLGWRQFNQQRAYESAGQVIEGRVVAPILRTGESKGQQVATLYLNYRFISPVTSKEIGHMNQFRRDDLTQADLPTEGSRLAVFYVNDRRFTAL